MSPESICITTGCRTRHCHHARRIREFEGFGGNNATGFFMSPDQTERMLAKRYGAQAAEAKQRHGRELSQLGTGQSR